MSKPNENFWPLSPEDIVALDSTPEAARKTSSVIGDLRSWNQTVSDLQGPYGWCSDEYFNDISSRTSLEVRAEQVGGSLAARLRQVLAPLDVLFLEKTEPMDSIWLKMPENYFWCRRIPINVRKDYQEDFNGFRVREKK